MGNFLGNCFFSPPSPRPAPQRPYQNYHPNNPPNPIPNPNPNLDRLNAARIEAERLEALRENQRLRRQEQQLAEERQRRIQAASIIEQRNRVQQVHNIPPVQCPVSLALPHEEVRFHHSVCCFPNCRKKARFSCGRCFSMKYCNAAHHQAAWPIHGLSCRNAISAAAIAVQFWIFQMKVRLRPSRPARVDPYKSFFVRCSANFYCSACKRPWRTGKCGFQLNLTTMAITKVFHQQCKVCNIDEEPEFVDLLNCLMKFFAWLRDLTDSSKSFDDQQTIIVTPPHEYDLCEICEYGENPHHH